MLRLLPLLFPLNSSILGFVVCGFTLFSFLPGEFLKQFIVRGSGVLNSFLRCVRPFCHCWCPPFSAGRAAFLFLCSAGDFFTFVSQVRCLHCWCPPFSAGHAAFLFICVRLVFLLLPFVSSLVSLLIVPSFCPVCLPSCLPCLKKWTWECFFVVLLVWGLRWCNFVTLTF